MKIKPASLDKKDLHELMVGAIVPRPIAFISTIGKDGIFNLAAFSFFNGLCLRPAIVAIGIGWRGLEKKDTLRNIEDSKDFVINMVTEPLAQAMNQSSADYPSEVDEFKEVGLTPVKADLVNAPLVAESPINMECKLVQTLEFGKMPTGSTVVIGEIVLVHVKDDLWAGDHIEISKFHAIGRLGQDLYCRTRDTFEMKRAVLT